MTAAELLRGLDRAATAGPWHWVDQDTDKPSAPGDDRASLRTVAESDRKHGFLGSALPDWILDAEGMNENWKADANRALIATTRNLLPLLAGLVEAVAAMGDPGTLGIYAACVRINEALAALEAAAAKEGV